MIKQFEFEPFKQRFPWIGGDLQTLRDTFPLERFPKSQSESIEIPIPPMPNGNKQKGKLLALFDLPLKPKECLGLVLILHGLGGSSQRHGVRRMAFSLQKVGFATLRLNLRGANPGRHLAPGTYSANCNSDLKPVLKTAKTLCHNLEAFLNDKTRSLPLFAVGISLGGTILINASLSDLIRNKNEFTRLDGLICTSSPLDLQACSASIEKRRNWVYQKWLLNRLINQTLKDPFSLDGQERDLLESWRNKAFLPKNIREFDMKITVPRWGFKNINDYYSRSSPLKNLLLNLTKLPPILFLQSLDDPWVPPESISLLSNQLSTFKTTNVDVVLTKHGGHNGFHGEQGCWGDNLVKEWLLRHCD